MDVARLRKILGLTQAGLGKLVGAHAMTVSKWERGVLQPTAFQRSLITALAAAGGAGDAAGPARDLAGLLNQAFIEVTEVGSMKLSASNQFKGRVIGLDEGPVTTRVLIEIAPKVVITSLITTASVRRLGLKVGKPAVAIIKATEVIIGAK
jgi:molybdopterin-binding protein